MIRIKAMYSIVSTPSRKKGQKSITPSVVKGDNRRPYGNALSALYQKIPYGATALHCKCSADFLFSLGYTGREEIPQGGIGMAFQIPSVPPTTNKNIRFPNTLIAQVEELIRGKESTFSAFVVAAVRAAVEEVQNQQDSDR